MLGIEKLKAVTLIILTAVKSLEEVFEDSKVTWWEVLGLTPELKSLIKVFEMLPEVGKELRDLEVSEVIEYQQFLVLKLNFSPNTTHFHVSGMLNSATNLYYSVIDLKLEIEGYMNK